MENFQNTNMPVQPEPKRGISTWLGLGIIVIIAILAGGGIWAYQYYISSQNSNPPTIESPKNETAGWKTYANNEYGFEVKLPLGYSFVSETITELGKYLSITSGLSPASTAYGIFIIRKDGLSLEELKLMAETSLKKVAPVDLKITWKDVLIFGIKAKEISYEEFAGGYTGITHKTIFVNNDIGYTVYMVEAGNEADYHRIISTFKFTHEINTSVLYKTDFNGGTLYGSLYRSDDSGYTWKEILRQYKGNIIYATDYKNSNIIYAGDTYGNSMAESMNIDLFRSTNKGENWVIISKGITDQIGELYGVSSIQIDPNDSNIVKVTVKTGSTSIDFKSIDGGDTWVKQF